MHGAEREEIATREKEARKKRQTREPCTGGERWIVRHQDPVKAQDAHSGEEIKHGKDDHRVLEQGVGHG